MKLSSVLEFDEMPAKLFDKLPPELWRSVKMFFVKESLKEKLQFPIVTCKRRSHVFYADYWFAVCGHHRWDIESGGPVFTSLISQYFKTKRISFDWSGLHLLIGERIFGVGFNIDDTFLTSIFEDDDYWNFENFYDEDDSNFLQMVMALEDGGQDF